jgi:hypothetical protein
MTPIPIRSAFDISSARNLLRQRIAKKNWLPPFRARAATSLTLMAELILRSEKLGMLDIAVLTRNGVYGVELKCNIENGENVLNTREYHHLEELADSVDHDVREGRIFLVVHLWLS